MKYFVSPDITHNTFLIGIGGKRRRDTYFLITAIELANVTTKPVLKFKLWI